MLYYIIVYIEKNHFCKWKHHVLTYVICTSPCVVGVCSFAWKLDTSVRKWLLSHLSQAPQMALAFNKRILMFTKSSTYYVFRDPAISLIL